MRLCKLLVLATIATFAVPEVDAAPPTAATKKVTKKKKPAAKKRGKSRRATTSKRRIVAKKAPVEPAAADDAAPTETTAAMAPVEAPAHIAPAAVDQPASSAAPAADPAEAPAPAAERSADARADAPAAASTASASATATARAQPAAQPIGLSVSVTGSNQYQNTDPRTVLLLGDITYHRPSGLAVYARLGWVRDDAAGANAISNALVGASLTRPLGAGFAGQVRLVGIAPVGQGGGNDANPEVLQSALSGTDWGGPMFAPDHATLGPGARLSFSHGPWFALADSTLYYAKRVRGEMVDPVGTSLLFTATKGLAGLAGRRGDVFAGAAQTRFTGNPGFVMADAAARDDYYVLGGLDLSLGVGATTTLRLGFLYARSLDSPKSDRKFQVGELTTGLDF